MDTCLEHWRLADSAVKQRLGGKDSSNCNKDDAGVYIRAKKTAHVISTLQSFVDTDTQADDPEGIMEDMRAEIRCNLEILQQLLETDTLRVQQLEQRLKDLDLTEQTSTSIADPETPTNSVGMPDEQPKSAALKSNANTKTTLRIATDTGKSNTSQTRAEHEKLSGELLRLAQELRQRHVRMHELVKADKVVMNQAEQALNDNAEDFAKDHRDLNQLRGKSWSGMIRMLLIYVAVGLSLILSFFLIIITRR